MSDTQRLLEVDPVMAQELADATKTYYDDVLKYRELGDDGLVKSIGNRALQVAAETRTALERRADSEVPAELEKIMSLFDEIVKNYSSGESLIKFNRNTIYQIFMTLINDKIKPHTTPRNQIAEVTAFNVIKSSINNIHHGEGPVQNLFNLLYERTYGHVLIAEVPEDGNEQDKELLSDVSISRISDTLVKGSELASTSCHFYDRWNGVYADESLKVYETNLSENGVAGVMVYHQLRQTNPYLGTSNRYRSTRVAFLPSWIVEQLKSDAVKKAITAWVSDVA